MQRATVVAELYNFAAYGSYDIYAIVILLKDWPSLCFKTFSINFVNYWAIMVMGLLSMVALAFILLLLICCLPCIIAALKEQQQL
mmetsp:Transcript_1294/g.815  ORF Transcript_1294/g.815 Transcript_1294/m.815 type:complete len:85 (+) Transcript_1294:354-608(+)